MKYIMTVLCTGSARHIAAYAPGSSSNFIIFKMGSAEVLHKQCQTAARISFINCFKPLQKVTRLAM
jgi:hypothetical protein